ncbi:hypothetical protein OPV22_004064 [Ensete ventricosum]|uniref:Uncharacterized protein n=1 Tax=Ensete ventricosum TaxID=4639 RepID=A0AAV8S2D5_ENSVE|nr:hypothetical protein OPV22_004064 [Ensete ventricosum]
MTYQKRDLRLVTSAEDFAELSDDWEEAKQISILNFVVGVTLTNSAEVGTTPRPELEDSSTRNRRPETNDRLFIAPGFSGDFCVTRSSTLPEQHESIGNDKTEEIGQKIPTRRT